MKTVRIVGRDDLDAVIASMPERVVLTTGDADITVATPSSFVDGNVPLLLFAPRLEVEAMPDAALVDITIERARIDELSAVVDALAVLRRLVAPASSVDVAHRSARLLVLRTGAATITIVESSGQRDAMHVRIVSRGARVDVEIDATALAAPARVATFTADGEHVAAPVHQSAVRLTLARALDGDVDDIAAELGLARTLL